MTRLYAVILFLFFGTLFVQAQSPVRVNLGDHSLEMISAGSGPYTIIFESGFGSDYKVWGRVAAELLKEHAVVLYSRAGTGQSDPVGDPGLESAVADLSALVRQAGLHGPLILVGHSYGAFVIRGFAASHPDQVKGMVFVDPAHEQLMIELSRLDPLKTARDQETQSRFTPEPYRKENDRINRIFEAGRLPDFGKLPDVPAMILTSVQKRPNPELFLHEPRGVAVWRRLHAEFFSRFSSGAHWVTPNSGHHIQRDEPLLVIRAIREVIQLAEQEKQRQEHALKVDGLNRVLKNAAAVQDSARAEKLVFDGSVASELTER
ncbi:MAG TPA: alpha/beta hydrolase, partial [Sphingobacteriaceae bacterium]